MMPPVGVQASVLSHDTIKVTWADNSLPKNQKITDNRYYTVRWKTNIPANTKVKVRDSCLTWICKIIGLKNLISSCCSQSSEDDSSCLIFKLRMSRSLVLLNLAHLFLVYLSTLELN